MTARSEPHRLHRKVLMAVALGVITGASLAMASPPTQGKAADGCRCNDQGQGSYRCNFEQTKCISGNETCQLVCS